MSLFTVCDTSAPAGRIRLLTLGCSASSLIKLWRDWSKHILSPDSTHLGISPFYSNQISPHNSWLPRKQNTAVNPALRRYRKPTAMSKQRELCMYSRHNVFYSMCVGMPGTRGWCLGNTLADGLKNNTSRSVEPNDFVSASYFVEMNSNKKSHGAK